MPVAEAMTIEQEMEELDGVLDVEMEAATADPEPEPEEEEKPEEEDVPKEEDSKDAEGDDKEVPTQETSEETPKDDEEDKKPPQEPSPDERYESLLAQINDLQGKLKAIPAVEESKGVDAETVDYLKDITMDDLDIDKLNVILNSVASQARKEAEVYLKAGASGMIRTQLDDRMTSRDIATQFYDAHQDLSSVRNVVKACADQVIQEHDDWTIEQVLNESAIRTRKSLGMPVPSANELPPAEKAAFAGGSKGTRKQTQNVSALQQELDEL